MQKWSLIGLLLLSIKNGKQCHACGQSHSGSQISWKTVLLVKQLKAVLGFSILSGDFASLFLRLHTDWIERRVHRITWNGVKILFIAADQNWCSSRVQLQLDEWNRKKQKPDVIGSISWLAAIETWHMARPSTISMSLFMQHLSISNEEETKVKYIKTKNNAYWPSFFQLFAGSVFRCFIDVKRDILEKKDRLGCCHGKEVNHLLCFIFQKDFYLYDFWQPAFYPGFQQDLLLFVS